MSADAVAVMLIDMVTIMIHRRQLSIELRRLEEG
jgi:hypothetical protein